MWTFIAVVFFLTLFVVAVRYDLLGIRRSDAYRLELEGTRRAYWRLNDAQFASIAFHCLADFHARKLVVENACYEGRSPGNWNILVVAAPQGAIGIFWRFGLSLVEPTVSGKGGSAIAWISAYLGCQHVLVERSLTPSSIDTAYDRLLAFSRLSRRRYSPDRALSPDVSSEIVQAFLGIFTEGNSLLPPEAGFSIGTGARLPSPATSTPI